MGVSACMNGKDLTNISRYVRKPSPDGWRNMRSPPVRRQSFNAKVPCRPPFSSTNANCIERLPCRYNTQTRRISILPRSDQAAPD
jgi:hypothetical protein